jgi:iron complex outermembrane receptor protein
VPGSGSQVFPGFQPGDAIDAKRHVYAAYVDGEYSINKFLLGAAGRFESYKETGVTYNGTGFKLTARYELSDNWAIHGSANTEILEPLACTNDISKILLLNS